MTISETRTNLVKFQVDCDGIHFESSGTPDELIPQVLRFLSQTIPTYDLARKLMYVPDLAGLADRVSEFAKMTSNSQPLLTRNELPAERSIAIVLFVTHLAAKFSKRSSESMSIEEIAAAVSKAPKTIRNTIVHMQKTGLLDRSNRGSYRITQKGLMELETTLKLAEQT
jgi:predicted transcriptional regulator